MLPSFMEMPYRLEPTTNHPEEAMEGFRFSTGIGTRMSRRTALSLAAAAWLPALPAAAMPITDARQRQVVVDDLSRLVCIGGTITEIVYALGLSSQIVAVDSTSQFPADALRDKKNVGYMRMLSAEGVLATNPSLLLVMEDAGPQQAIEVLQNSRVPLLFIDSTPTPDAVLGRVRFLASVLRAPQEGDRLSQTIESGFSDLAAWRSHHPGGQRVLFVLSMQNGRPVVAGTGTSANEIIALAGGVNAAASLGGYKPVGDETIPTFAPDVVLAMDHAGPSIDATVFDQTGFRLTKAGQHRRLIHMDGELLLGFGPRTPTAALELAKQLVASNGPG